MLTLGIGETHLPKGSQCLTRVSSWTLFYALHQKSSHSAHPGVLGPAAEAQGRALHTFLSRYLLSRSSSPRSESSSLCSLSSILALLPTKMKHIFNMPKL